MNNPLRYVDPTGNVPTDDEYGIGNESDTTSSGSSSTESASSNSESKPKNNNTDIEAPNVPNYNENVWYQPFLDFFDSKNNDISDKETKFKEQLIELGIDPEKMILIDNVVSDNINIVIVDSVDIRFDKEDILEFKYVTGIAYVIKEANNSLLSNTITINKNNLQISSSVFGFTVAKNSFEDYIHPELSFKLNQERRVGINLEGKYYDKILKRNGNIINFQSVTVGIRSDRIIQGLSLIISSSLFPKPVIVPKF